MKKTCLMLTIAFACMNLKGDTGMSIYNVMDFGAKGDGTTLETKAIQDTIDACSKAGGGIVYFPSGKNFLTGTIYLKSNITLSISAGTQLLGSTDMKDYGVDTGICPYYPEALDRCLIYAKNATNIVIEGQGTIDGQFRGILFKQIDGAEGRDAKQRPMLIRFHECSDIQMRDLMLKGSSSWCNHFQYCSNIKLENLSIFNDRQDGFNIESCEDINISNCNLKCGDDGIALTTSHRDRPLKNLTVNNCIIGSSWAAIRLGPLSRGNFENITVANCVFNQCNGGGIKIGMFEGAEIKNCLFSDIVMDEVTCPIGIFTVRYKEIGSTSRKKQLMPAGRIANIRFQDMRIKAVDRIPPPNKLKMDKNYDSRIHPNWAATLFIHGHSEMDIENIRLSNIHVTFPGGGTLKEGGRRDMEDMDQMGTEGVWTEHKKWGVIPAYGLYARHVKGLELDSVRFDYAGTEDRTPLFIYESSDIDIQNMVAEVSPQAEAFITLRDTQDCRIFNSRPLTKAKAFLCMEGAASEDATLMNNDFRKAEESVLLKEGAQGATIHRQGNIE